MAAPMQQQGLLPTPPAPPPATGGRRRRGCSGGRRRNKQQNSAVVTVPEPPPTGAPPIPRFLASHLTPEQNDPLWIPSSILKGEELYPVPGLNYLYSTAGALPHIISTVYSSYSAAFGKRVSESALGYYSAVLVWHRMLSLHRGNGLYLSWEEDRFVNQVDTLHLQAPLLLSHFLASIGNIRPTYGGDFLFRLGDRPQYIRAGNVSGWFGRVSHQTISFYRDYPCLAVYASRIQASLAGCNDPNWRFPNEICEGGNRLYAGCLGYGPRERLCSNEVDFLNRCGVYAAEGFPSENPVMPLNLALLSAVHVQLRRASRLELCPLSTAMLASQV